MISRPQRAVAAGALVIGAAFGMAGTFAPSNSLRSLAWGLDGTALVVAAALLAVHYIHRDNGLAAAGFLVYLAGQTLVVAGSAMAFEASAPLFGAGAGLWAAALVMISASGAMSRAVNALGFLAALLFAVVSVRLYQGAPLTPLSQPLPFFAYPVFVATLIGWAWSTTAKRRDVRDPEPEALSSIRAARSQVKGC